MNVKKVSKKGAFKQFEGIDLIVSPGTKISKPLENLIVQSGGTIREFNIAEQALLPWVR